MNLLPPGRFLSSSDTLQLRRLFPNAYPVYDKLGTVLHDKIVTHKGSQSPLRIVELPAQFLSLFAEIGEV
jgi:hypothetical protein